MDRRRLLTGLLLGALWLLAGTPSPAAAPDRFLDPPRPAGDGIRLVVFDPTPYNIRCIAALRSRGILDLPNLTVIGVYHQKQKGGFEESRKLVQDAGHDWFKFHEVSAAIDEPTLFTNNPCTPEFEAIVQKSDGVVFFGGPDIPSSVFGKKTHLLVDITDPFRHYLELSAVFHFLGGAQNRKGSALLDARPGFPILGICLGFQTLNVGTGGTLIQDIPAELYRKSYVEDVIAQGPEQWHNNPYKRLHPLDRLMSYNFHSLKLGERSKFTREMGFTPKDHPRVLSSHHQALGRLGLGWAASARSRDGKVVEAIEHRKYPNVLGVQFHPEHHQLWDTELRIRQKPGEPLTSYHAILTGTPPSLEFNQAIWKWLGAKLQESRGH
jgi:putative glutamine amidotransferase